MSHDPTEPIRRILTTQINSQAVDTANAAVTKGEDPEVAVRKSLEAEHGKVYNTAEMQADFEAIGFMSPFIMVKRRSDGVEGTLEFTHLPRFYFNFQTN